MQWRTWLIVWALCSGRRCSADDVDLSSLLGQIRTPTQFCGVQLSRALSTVCKGNYNDLHQAQQTRGARTYGYYADQPALPYPYQTRQQARDMLGGGRGRHHRRRRGVYNECCAKPCTHEELSSYCGPAKS